MAGRAHRRDGHLRYIKAPVPAEQAAMLFRHGGQKICCFLSQLFSLSFFLDFVWKPKEEKMRAKWHTISAFHLRTLNSACLCCEAINTQTGHFDGLGLHGNAKKPGQVPHYFRCLKCKLSISHSHCAVNLYGPKLSHQKLAFLPHYGYFKSSPIFLNIPKYN